MAEKIVDMMINGHKVSVSEKVLNSRMMREKKVEVEVNGKIIRCSEHMLEDIMRFGGATKKRVIKNPPKEVLLMMERKTIILPKKEEIKEPELPPAIPTSALTAEPPVDLIEKTPLTEYPGPDKEPASPPVIRKVVKKAGKKTIKAKK